MLAVPGERARDVLDRVPLAERAQQPLPVAELRQVLAKPAQLIERLQPDGAPRDVPPASAQQRSLHAVARTADQLYTPGRIVFARNDAAVRHQLVVAGADGDRGWRRAHHLLGHGGEPFRFGQVIGMNEERPVVIGGERGKHSIDVRALARVLTRWPDFHRHGRAPRAARGLDRLVAGSIVGDVHACDAAKTLLGLNGLQRRGERRGVVVCRNDDGDARRAHRFSANSPKVPVSRWKTLLRSKPGSRPRYAAISSGTDGYTASQSGTNPSTSRHRGRARMGKARRPAARSRARRRRSRAVLTRVSYIVSSASRRRPRFSFSRPEP